MTHTGKHKVAKRGLGGYEPFRSSKLDESAHSAPEMDSQPPMTNNELWFEMRKVTDGEFPSLRMIEMVESGQREPSWQYRMVKDIATRKKRVMEVQEGERVKVLAERRERVRRPRWSVPADSPEDAALYLAERMGKHEIEELIDKLIEVNYSKMEKMVLGQELMGPWDEL